MTTVFLVSIVAPLVYENMSAHAAAYAPDPASWYMQVNGQLNTDHYSSYPYYPGYLQLGFSKYGEFIDNNTDLGLQYTGLNGARDPWAPLAGTQIDVSKLPKYVWVNGWYIDITYNHSVWGLRNVWAGALYGDLASYGGPWLKVSQEMSSALGQGTYPESQESFKQPGYEIAPDGSVIGTTPAYGGRKTNGTATTDPINVLYDGPREFVAVLTNHVSDVQELTNTSIRLVDVIFTLIFDKVSKQIEVLKDVKIASQAKYVLSGLVVQVPEGNPSVMTTMTVTSGMLVQFSNREEWDLGAPGGTTSYTSYAHFYTAGTAPNDTVSEGQSTVYDDMYTALPTIPANVSIVNGWQNTSAYGSQPYSVPNATYDVAQIISNDKKFVGYAGYWPSLSDWSIDAGGGRRDLWWRAIGANDAHDIDSYISPNDEPFLSPMTVGEWDFMLSDQARVIAPGFYTNVQFRGVAVYGLTDLNDGSDANFKPYSSTNTNIIDREVRYQLDTIYNPWDLEQALQKSTTRWVMKEPGDGVTKNYPLLYSNLYPQDPYVDETYPYVGASDFTGSQATWNGTYWNMTWTPWDSYNYYNAFDLTKASPSYYQPIGTSFPERVYIINSTGFATLLKRGVDYNLFTNATVVNPNSQSAHYNWTNGDMWINFTTAPGATDMIKVLFSTGDKCKLMGAAGGGSDLRLKMGYSCGGSWEWGTVGRDSAAVDSVGLGMATEWAMGTGAPVTMTGFDMQDTVFGPTAPYTLAQDANASLSRLLPSRTGYLAENVGPNEGRLNLKDDWSCHLNNDSQDALYGDYLNGVPVASSNIISVGGPSANAMAQYFNDFTSAFATLGSWTPNPANAGKIMPLTCWSLNKNDTTSDPDFHGYVPTYDASGNEVYGYGVISTYKDLNGTIGFLVWGYTGQDTYYTSWSLLHSNVLAVAFSHMPCGVTSLILRFNYTDHPTDYSFTTVVEALGTISEYDYQSKFGFGPFVTQWTSDPIGTMFSSWPAYPLWVPDPSINDVTGYIGKYPTIHVDP